MAVVLETSIGDITVDLYTDERPRCCLNFLKLCKIKYYNFNLFHTVQKGLVAQTGDPSGVGKGGEAIFAKLYGDQAKYFEMEYKPKIKHKKLGCLSMANNGGDMHGSQFFITLGTDIDYLDGKHTVFGEVAEGFDILKKFNETFVDADGRPYQDIRIFHTVVLDDPFDDPAGLSEYIPDRSPEPTKEMLDSGRLGVDEKIDDTEGMTTEEVEEMMAGKQAKANAELLEMIGDLPDADVKPPDNVLFVCKLNPVTTDEDLEIIFSRFGTIKSCEVIRDRKTNESLQYAFIEFETEDECASAYFKMDNVLIDDRRIHVDFSQSVSKLKWKGKGKGVEHMKDPRQEELLSYKIKDRSRKDDRYDLVFDEDQLPESHSKSKKQKKKKRRSSSSESNSSARHSRSYKHKKHSRSRSPRRSRSYSPQRKHKPRHRSKEKSADRDRHRDSEPYRYKNSDRDRHRDGDRDRHRDEGRDRHRDEERDRYRDEGRDRHRDEDRDRYRDEGRDRHRNRHRDDNRSRDYRR